MDTVITSTTPSQLLSSFGTSAAPLLLDVRRKPAFEADSRMMAGAIWRDPADVAAWAKYLPVHRDIVVYCVHGFEVSRNTSEALAATGLRASYLEGGIEAWRAAGGATLRKDSGVPSALHQPTRWITRERPKVDRIACPWLIRRFIDPLAEFLYVPSDQVMHEAARLGAIAYDVPGVTFTHRGELCSFDAFIADFDLHDAALDQLAVIVRGADTDHLALAPQSAGLLALSLGLSANIRDDHVMLAHGMTLYDALYAWCRSTVAGRAERHNWTYPS